MQRGELFRRLRNRFRSALGVTTIEYIMILSLFSVPLSLLVGTVLQKILRQLITTIVERFTTG